MKLKIIALIMLISVIAFAAADTITRTYSVIFKESGGANTMTVQPVAMSANYVLSLPPDDGDASECLQTNGSGVLTWEPCAAGGTGWNLDGNTVGSEKWIGTIDNFDFPIRTNNVERVLIEADGEVKFKDSSNNDLWDFASNSNQRIFRAALPPGVNLQRANTSLSSPSIIANFDQLGIIRNYGYDGNSYAISSSIVGGIFGTPGDGDVPGYLSIQTSPDGTEVPTDKIVAYPSSSVIGNPAGTPSSGVVLDVQSTTNTMRIPRVPTASLPSGLEGMLVYDDTKNSLTFHNGTQYCDIRAGAWTSTLTAGTNTAAAVFITATFLQVCDRVAWTMRLEIDPTSANINTTTAATLPIPSAFSSVNQVTGHCEPQSQTVVFNAYVIADVGGDRFDFILIPGTTANVAYSCSGTYIIL